MEWKGAMSKGAKEYAITGRGRGQWSIRTSSRLRLRKAQKRMIVEVHQVVRDLRGNLLADKMVGHIFRVENGLVRRFDIRGT
jgi:hypothetical protein